MAGMQDSQCPAPADAGDAIARLRQRVQALMDGDKVLPADGSFLLMALDQAQEGLSGTGEPAGRSAIETFMRRVQGLMEAGVLAAEDGQPPVEAAAVLIAGLPIAGGPDGRLAPADRPAPAGQQTPHKCAADGRQPVGR